MPLGSQSLPLASLFTLLHIFVHANLSLHLLSLLSPEHPVLSLAAANTRSQLPLPYGVLFIMSAIAPVFSVLLRHAWLDVVWWCATLLVSWFIYSGQSWVREEEESIEKLEKMRYTARGA